MFKGMPKAFWIGCGIMYGWDFLFMILEFFIPGLPVMRLFGVPAAYIYALLCGLLLINVIVAWYFYASEEAREAKAAK